MSSSCLAVPTASTTGYTLSAASQLPTASTSSRVVRNGTKLQLAGVDFKVVGPNVYWLGLDENVDPTPSYPIKGRVLEAMAAASAMGATTIRSQTLGISVGTGLSIENALNTFKANNSAAWDAVDFAVFAAKSYNVRLILPLTDQYDYYHGGIPTFLRWRNLSSTDYSPFYDLTSDVYSDFTAYIRHLLSHVSPYTNLTLASDPTVLALETGNELGGWSGSSYPPPVEWTTAIATLLKGLAPETLVISGSYGVRKDELGIADLDVVSDHFYPTYTSRLSSSGSLAHSHDKAFLAGEYDWTNSLYSKLRWSWFAMALPLVLAAAIWGWPGKKTRTTTLRGLMTCGACGRRRRKGRGKARVIDEPTTMARPSTPPYSSSYPPSYPAPADSPSSAHHDTKSLFASSSSALPMLPSSTRSTDALSSSRHTAHTRTGWLDRPFLLRRWYFSLAVLVLLLPILGACLHTFLPSSISAFLSRLSSLSTTSTSSTSPEAIGDLYWSLFGRDDACCAYVEHSDGYTLHYPSNPAATSGRERGSGAGVLRLTQHAWEVRGERPYWLTDEGKEVKDLKLEDLPVVSCPQAGLTLSNGTIVAG